MNIILTKTRLEILKAISYIIDIEEGQKLFHSWRVAAMSKCLAQEKSRESYLLVYIAGLLHDVGTFDLCNRLIHHKAHMENIEEAAVRIHPQKGAAIVASLQDFIPIARIILDHHEWISAEGYPRGLKEDEISLESQILRITDKIAFLIDTKTATEITTIQEKLQNRIGREFSKELYECLISQLEKKDLLETIVNERSLVALTKEIFAQLPVESKDELNVDRELLHFFGRILDAKHAYTEGHSRRVSYFSVLIALALNLADELIEQIESAALLHDIGKVGIPKSILDKSGPLTSEEYQLIKRHSVYSYELVKGISAFTELADIVGADQEHWDGSGYPKGLKKAQIPLGSRIIFIADAFDAMTSNRSYHKAASVPDAIEELRKYSGEYFDPEIVDVACRIFEGFKNSSILASYIDKNI
jgi:HD-GYP domain-containing protein (c-di-GMP phosphodiesterase class II)